MQKCDEFTNSHGVTTVGCSFVSSKNSVKPLFVGSLVLLQLTNDCGNDRFRAVLVKNFLKRLPRVNAMFLGDAQHHIMELGDGVLMKSKITLNRSQGDCSC